MAPVQMTADSLPPGSYLDETKIVNQDKWRAQEPFKYAKELTNPLTTVLFTYTNTDTCDTYSECCKSMQDIQRFHMRYHLRFDIPYNFMLGGDGNIYMGRSFLRSVPLPLEYKPKIRETIVIACVGPIQEDPEKQLKDFKLGYDLLDYAIDQEFLTSPFTLDIIPQDWNVYEDDPD